MADTILRRTPIQLLLVGALLFLLASIVPPAVIGWMRPIDSGLSLNFATRPAPTMLITATSTGLGEIPEENVGRPECRLADPSAPSAPSSRADLPYSCLTAVRDTRQVTALTTSDAPKRGEVEVDALLQVRQQDTVLAEIDDSLRLDRRSTFPVSDPVSHLTVSIPHLGSGAVDEGFVREGLHYFFPFPTSRESYAWYDMAAREPLWLDYVGETRHNDVDTYEFHQSIPAIEMSHQSAVTIALRPEEQESLATHADSGLGTPYYAVERTVWVEPESGVIVDIRTEPHLYFAADATEAAERAFAPSRDYTIYHTLAEWDEETLAQQHDQATDVAGTLRALQVFAVLLKTLALILVGWAVVLLVRERRELRELQELQDQ